MHKLWASWLHHCTDSREREEQMLTHPQFITLIGKFRRRAIILSVKCGETCTGVVTQKKVKQRASFRYGENFSKNINKFKSSLNDKHIKLLKENKKLYQDSLKRIFTREFFLKNKEAIYSQRQNTRYFCRNLELSKPTVLYKT